MKIKFWLIPMLLLGGGLLLTGCEKGDELPSPPGSFKDNTNYDAPKAIGSAEIVTFRCSFSLVDMMLPEGHSELADHQYVLTAEWKDGVVTGGYDLCTRFYDKESHSFQAGREFLDALQALVEKHDLAQYNGLSRQVYGLPEEFGAELSITYASGESVYASDNQDCFLPLEVMEDLAGLFRQQLEP